MSPNYTELSPKKVKYFPLKQTYKEKEDYRQTERDLKKTSKKQEVNKDENLFRMMGKCM